MKLTISNLNLPLDRSLDAIVENRLVALSERLRIDDATVVIERRVEASPPYRVHLHISVPGPDLHTEMLDNTPIQALTRALKEIEHKIRDRSSTRFARLKPQGSSACRVGNSPSR